MTSPFRRWALVVSWSLVLPVLLTLETGAPFTLLEPLHVEQGLALALYLATSAFWLPRWRTRGVVYAHLLVVVLVLVLHPLTTTLERDGAFAVTALHLGLTVCWLTGWRAEYKLLVLSIVVGLALVETILSAVGEGPPGWSGDLADYGDLMGPTERGAFSGPTSTARSSVPTARWTSSRTPGASATARRSTRATRVEIHPLP
ncbi:MAG: hypothetical protein LJF30_06235 [Acidobacteria bacterium]|nr:hypothetical protein [Acidobacteriota bacterium]